MIDISEKELKMVLDIIVNLASDCEVRVFGSRFKGTAKKYSDIDLVIVGKEKLGLKRLGELKEAFDESDLPYRVDILDYHAVNENIRKNIDKGYETIFVPITATP
ncbi:MAG: nucleotidyltransferase domain-containing protein [Planctomycetaceae bacterium]|jgi:predicted nucleotidyltransferase|nr:nucleotidyltransferase domain-containing protein [Planctomycetaceae bacterium]